MEAKTTVIMIKIEVFCEICKKQTDCFFEIAISKQVCIEQGRRITNQALKDCSSIEICYKCVEENLVCQKLLS